MKRKKIILLNPPAKRLTFRDYYCSFTSKGNYYWPPLDLLVLSGILFEYYEVKVIDAVVEKLSSEDCFKKIIQENADTIIFLAGTASWKADLSLISQIKRNREITAVASGGLLLHKGYEFMKRFEFLDAIILDFTTNDILKFLENKSDKIDNMIYRRDGDIIVGVKTSPRKDFRFPIPRHELFPITKYRMPTAKRKPFSVVITTFGCPFKCRFCIGSTIGYKSRSIENIIEELEYISSLGIREIFFLDYTFTVGKKRVIEICKSMIQKQIDFTWSCQAHSATLDEEMLMIMMHLFSGLIGVL